ncbi:CLUMA_CG012833, isoform A [Clunio marinus]|uniref:CLUMA_CG012833, isoform A n=1 Tax=Clunio marinus TaxID=568069 RepID=A0A1J1IIC8_9DIPT|nr:CLUMA_CG012833, isoform A [Clunio marinus]
MISPTENQLGSDIECEVLGNAKRLSFHMQPDLHSILNVNNSFQDRFLLHFDSANIQIKYQGRRKSLRKKNSSAKLMIFTNCEDFNKRNEFKAVVLCKSYKFKI